MLRWIFNTRTDDVARPIHSAPRVRSGANPSYSRITHTPHTYHSKGREGGNINKEATHASISRPNKAVSIVQSQTRDTGTSSPGPHTYGAWSLHTWHMRKFCAVPIGGSRGPPPTVTARLPRSGRRPACVAGMPTAMEGEDDRRVLKSQLSNVRRHPAMHARTNLATGARLPRLEQIRGCVARCPS